MGRLERTTYRDARLAGVVHLADRGRIGASAWASCSAASSAAPPPRSSPPPSPSPAGCSPTKRAPCSSSPATATSSPRDAASPASSGATPPTLDATGIVRAAVESVAENTVDAVTAPLLWAAIGGAPAVLAHRAVNTLDAMVGHRNARYRRFGWAAARADDVANWVPARLTALAVAAVRPRRATAVVRTIRRDAGRHPSPNGGVVEAAFAAALGVRLGGTNAYAGTREDRGQLGDGPPATVADGDAAIRLARHTAAVIAITVALLPVVAANRQR